MTQRNNNKGFSLVELLVVIAIMAVAVSLVSYSFVSVYRARSKRAAETLDAVISQCKIDSMSGLDCALEVALDDGNYYVNLYRIDESGNMNLYKTEKLASDRLSITADSDSIEDDPLIIRFNSSDGSISSAVIGTTDYLESASTLMLTLSSTGTHTITLYKNTGEHVLDA
ncbi:MAG: prepilin-type N-terminal cleavage/methylation domain-containing protein [Clostridia bacterium]|nr:prepilin-type N-terminal cleavage/methylation domain-containing protein [Clostridia bacterium]